MVSIQPQGALQELDKKIMMQFWQYYQKINEITGIFKINITWNHFKIKVLIYLYKFQKSIFGYVYTK